MRFFLEDQENKERFEILPGTGIIGREPANSVAMKGRGISRRHLRIVFEGGEVNVQDLGSSNGTFVNGKKISTSKLAEGDTIRIGVRKFILRAERGGGDYGAVDATMPAQAIQELAPAEHDYQKSAGDDTPVDAQFVAPMGFQGASPEAGGEVVPYQPESFSADGGPVLNVSPEILQGETMQAAAVVKPKFGLTKRVKIIAAVVLGVIIVSVLVKVLFPHTDVKERIKKSYPDIVKNSLKIFLDDVSGKLTVEDGDYSKVSTDDIAAVVSKSKKIVSRLDEAVTSFSEWRPEYKKDKPTLLVLSAAEELFNDRRRAFALMADMLEYWNKGFSAGWESYIWPKLLEKIKEFKSTKIVSDAGEPIGIFLNGLEAWAMRENKARKDVIVQINALIAENTRSSLDKVMRDYNEDKVSKIIPQRSVYRKVYESLIKDSFDRLLSMEDKATARLMGSLASDSSPRSDILASLTDKLRKAIKTNKEIQNKFHKDVIGHINKYYLQLDEIYQNTGVKNWSAAENNFAALAKFSKEFGGAGPDFREKISRRKKILENNKQGDQKLSDARNLMEDGKYDEAKKICAWIVDNAPAYSDEGQKLLDKIRDEARTKIVENTIRKFQANLESGKWQTSKEAFTSIEDTENKIQRLRESESWRKLKNAIYATLDDWVKMKEEQLKPEADKDYDEIVLVAKRVLESCKDFQSRYKNEAERVVADKDDEFFADWYYKRGVENEKNKNLFKAREYYDKANQRSAGKADAEISKIRSRAKELFRDHIGKDLKDPANADAKKELEKIFDGLRPDDDADKKIYTKLGKMLGRIKQQK